MKIQTFSIVAGSTACNARCPFCVSKMTPKQGVDLEKPEVNWRNFRKACLLAERCGVTTVLITGKGEPTLFPEQITEYLSELLEYHFPLIELQTNGILLSTEKDKYEPYLRRWYELGLTTVAISIVHYDSKKNQKMYIPKEPVYPNLGDIIDYLHRIGFSVRISCVLINGIMDNTEDLSMLIGMCKVHGVEQLTLRPVNISNNCKDEDMLEWFEVNMLTKSKYDDIVSYLYSYGNPIMQLIHGATVYDVNGQNVCLTNSLTIDPIGGEQLRQLIFFPDGHLRYDWQYEGAVIL